MRVRVRELRADAGTTEPALAREDRVVTEEPMELRLDWPGHPAERVWVTMRTPGHDFELAAGWIHHEALAPAELVQRVAYCTDTTLSASQEFNVVTVTLSGPPSRQVPARLAGLSAGSACGVCGKDSIEEALAAPHGPRWDGPELTGDLVRGLPERLREHQRQFGRTGGSHAAALVDGDGELLVVREDVGRHNAVDKVSGALLLGGSSPRQAALVVSGRAGFELVQKAVACGVGALVAIGAPTSLSVSLARHSGLALYGFTRADRTVRYT